MTVMYSSEFVLMAINLHMDHLWESDMGLEVVVK